MKNNQIRPHPIEAKSMEIIENKVDLSTFNQDERAVVKRIIHTTGDLEIHHDIEFSETAIVNGINALKEGRNIYTDVNMVKAGLNKKHLTQLNSDIYCNIDNEEVIKQAKSKGNTRSETSMEQFKEKLQNQIIAIGNAPTALEKVLDLHREQNITPALVVGVPVGFVGAKESKKSLSQSELPYITVQGYKGGSPIAACIVNALIRLL